MKRKSVDLRRSRVFCMFVQRRFHVSAHVNKRDENVPFASRLMVEEPLFGESSVGVSAAFWSYC